ncbi:MAG TPA: histidine--tRNA ligase [Candidatus Paceibacterota bacterium]
MSKNLSTDPYKGVRDFFPEDMAIQNQIFQIWRNAAEKYGYQEYNASVLEPAELFRAKSGEEIIERQTYTFKDRGDREVTLRPEMTPSVARMVAARKRELIFPLRWYSIPNFFRYEQPQRGRIREFWQLNVDIFGVESLQAEVECISMAYDITLAYGLSPSNFEIRINSRKILNYITQNILGLDFQGSQKILKLIDNKNKIPPDVFTATAESLLGDKVEIFMTIMSSQNFLEFTQRLNQSKEEHEGIKEIREVMEALEKLGITNARFDQTLTRGADYYTGVIFEVFDKNPLNRRSVFGGGRFDDLLSLFGNEKVTAFGFGAGDLVARDLMETYGKLAKPESIRPADIYICLINNEVSSYGQEVAQKLRSKGKRVSLDYSGRKLGDQIKNADRNHIPYIICIGDDEVKTGKLKIKNLKTGEETLYEEDNI